MEPVREDDALRGAYPGGPVREADAERPKGPPLRTRARRGLQKLVKRARRVLRSRVGRVRLAVVAVVTIGLAVGWGIGWAALKTPEDLAMDDLKAAEIDALDQQVDRVLRELWLMEAAEGSNGLGGRR